MSTQAWWSTVRFCRGLSPTLIKIKGRAGFDFRHRAFIGGSLTGPLKVQLNPFIIMSSAAPFNITTGSDTNGDGLFNDRPAFATSLASKRGAHGLRQLRYLPHNYGDGYGSFSVNLRLSRSWGFGERASAQGDAMGGGGGHGGPGGGGAAGNRRTEFQLRLSF